MPGGQKVAGTTQTGVAHQETKQGAGAGQGREQTQQNTNAQGRGKALDQAGAKEEKSCTTDQRGQVTIDDR